MNGYNCYQCGKSIDGDEVALTRKLLGRQLRHFMCFDCLASYLKVSVHQLHINVEEFRRQGCSLFPPRY